MRQAKLAIAVLSTLLSLPTLATAQMPGIALDQLGPFPILQLFAGIMLTAIIGIALLLWLKAGAFIKPKEDPVKIETDGGIKINASQLQYYEGPLKSIDTRLAEILSELRSVRLVVKDDNAAMSSDSRHKVIGAISETQAELTQVVNNATNGVEALIENRFRDLNTTIGENGRKVDAAREKLVHIEARLPIRRS